MTISDTVRLVVRSHCNDDLSDDQIENEVLDDLIAKGVINDSKDYEMVLPIVRDRIAKFRQL